MTDGTRYFPPKEPFILTLQQEVHHAFPRSFPNERAAPLRELVRIWLRGDNQVLRLHREVRRPPSAQLVAGLVLIGLAVGFCLGLYFSPWLVPALRPLQLVARTTPEPGSVLWLAEGE